MDIKKLQMEFKMILNIIIIIIISTFLKSKNHNFQLEVILFLICHNWQDRI